MKQFQPGRKAPQPQSVEVLAVPGALLKLQTVCTVVGLGGNTIYRKVAEGVFPEPIRMGARCTRWRSDDIRAWLAKQ